MARKKRGEKPFPTTCIPLREDWSLDEPQPRRSVRCPASLDGTA